MTPTQPEMRKVPLADQWWFIDPLAGKGFFSKWVKEWRCRHPLPVVAMESILHIYRRAVFRLRATPASDVFPGQSLRFGTE